jgi:hypothetical protein
MKCEGLNPLAQVFDDILFTCTPIIAPPVDPEPPTETPDEDFLATNVIKVNEFRYKIEFNYGIDTLLTPSVSLNTHVFPSISNLVKGSDFDTSWSVSNSDPNSYYLQINFLKSGLVFSEQLSIKVQSVYADPSLFTPTRRLLISSEDFLYPSIVAKVYVNKLSPIFGLTLSQQGSISTATKTTLEFGGLLILASSVLASILIPLNVAQLIALLPIKLQPKMISLLSLLVDFDKQNFITDAMDATIYKDEQERNKRIFWPTNSTFSFVSIYTRARGYKLIIRWIINLIYFLVIRRIIRSIPVIEDKIRKLQANSGTSNIA